MGTKIAYEALNFCLLSFHPRIPVELRYSIVTASHSTAIIHRALLHGYMNTVIQTPHMPDENRTEKTNRINGHLNFGPAL